MEKTGTVKLEFSERLDQNMVVDCEVEKYKKPGLKNMFGNKSKKWLKLDVARKIISYRPDQIGIKGEKSILLDAINNVILDLSKPGKYYIEFFCTDRIYRFKFLNLNEWFRMSEAFTKMIRKEDRVPLLKPNEKYLEMLIEYKTKVPLEKKNNNAVVQNLTKELNGANSKKPEIVERDDGSSDSSNENKEKMDEGKMKKVKLDLTQKEDNQTDHGKAADLTTKVKINDHKKEDRKNEEVTEEQPKIQNEIIRQRRNI